MKNSSYPPIELTEERKKILSKQPKPSLKPGTIAHRILQNLNTKVPTRYKALTDAETAHREANIQEDEDISQLEPYFSQLVATMVYYNQIKQVGWGLYMAIN